MRNNFLDGSHTNVPLLFILAAPSATIPSSLAASASSDSASVGRVGRLLAVVRKLIDYGRELAAALQSDPATRPRQFGTGDIALILARITQGLHRARALEERLVRNAHRLDTPPRPRTAPTPRPSGSTAHATPCSHADDSHLAGLPTSEQIAAQVRRRPIGAVLADICRDLGILPSHPLWPELSEVIVRHGGSLVTLLKDILTQATRGFSQHWAAAWPLPAPLPPGPSHTGADPP